MAAGALFGPLQGTALVSLASTLGAALAFLVSRLVQVVVGVDAASNVVPSIVNSGASFAEFSMRDGCRIRCQGQPDTN